MLPLRLRLRVLLGPGSRPDTSPLVRSAIRERMEKVERQREKVQSETALRRAPEHVPAISLAGTPTHKAIRQ